MLSDTIFDAVHEILKDISRMHEENYGYDQDQIEEVMRALVPLAAIRIDYDAGGDGVPGEGSALDKQSPIEAGSFTEYVFDRIWIDLTELAEEYRNNKK